jgi:hypothetical protein
MWNSPTTWHFYKWLPVYYPNDPWEVVGSSGPPEGAIVPWWKQPKDQWPYPAPWEMKAFGAFPPMWFKMREDIGAPLPPGTPTANPWPSTGLTKVKTPDYRPGTKNTSIKVHMRPEEWLSVSPHPSLWAEGKYEATLREMARKRPIRIVNEDGSSITLKGLRSANWQQHQKDYRKRKAELARNFK